MTVLADYVGTCDTCGRAYPLGESGYTDEGYRCGDCGDCGRCCTHEARDRGAPDYFATAPATEVLDAIRAILYLEDDGAWNPDKEWNADTTEAIADLMSRAGRGCPEAED
jgi:hypothetical protein